VRESPKHKILSGGSSEAVMGALDGRTGEGSEIMLKIYLLIGCEREYTDIKKTETIKRGENKSANSL